MDIGDKLKAARADAGMTQEQVAEALGVSRQTVSNWENSRTYPDIISVIRMSDLYVVSLDILLKEEKAMTNNKTTKQESSNPIRIIWQRARIPSGAATVWKRSLRSASF